MKKILTFIMVLALTIVMAVPTFAENKYQTEQTPDNLVDVAGVNNAIGINKYFITKQGSVVPATQFTFTLTPTSGVTATSGTAAKWTYGGFDYPTEAQAKEAVDEARAGGSDDTYDDIVYTAGTSGTMEIISTVVSDSKVSALPVFVSGTNQTINLSFADTDTKNTTVASGDKVHLDTNEQYQKKTAYLNFSGVRFYEPGVYRYKITETYTTSPALSGMVLDTQIGDFMNSGKSPAVEGTKERFLDVYVTDNESASFPNNLVVSAYVLHENATPYPAVNENKGTADVDANGDPLDDKSDGFVNEYQTVDLAVKKEVAGNQGSKDKYFAITVKVPGAVSGQNYVVSVANDSVAGTNDGNCDATSGTNAATIVGNANKKNFDAGTGTVADPYTVTGANLISGKTFYLQHGQHIVIRGLPAGSTYEVTENAEDYKKEEAAVTDYKNLTKVESPKTLATQDAISDADGTTAVDADGIVRTSFKNTRGGIIPTGLIMAATSGIALVVIALALLAAIRRKNNMAEED